MALYSTGTVTVTNGSTTVQGSGTAWFGALQAGWVFIGPNGLPIGIANVVSDTELTLTRAYLGANASAQQYECFPTMSLAGDLASAFQGISANFQGMIDGVGQGKFPDGSAAAPGVRFESDPDTGVRRVSSNKGALVAGGNDVLTFAPSGLGGTGIQSGFADAGAGKLLKVGAFGLGLDDGNLSQSPNDNLDTLRIAGVWRYASATIGAPSSAGVVQHFSRLSGEDAGRHVQMALAHGGQFYVRVMADATGAWGGWMSVASSGFTANHPLLSLNGALIGGGTLAIADDAVATISPPRTGGWAFLGVNVNSDYPLPHFSGAIFYDCGNSLDIQTVYAGASFAKQSAGALTGTTGADGKVTVSPSAGLLQVENRTGGTIFVQLSFL